MSLCTFIYSTFGEGYYYIFDCLGGKGASSKS